MSTKIYDAYEFKGTLPQLTKLLISMRAAVHAAVIRDAKKNDTFNAKTLDEPIKMLDLQRALDRAMGSHQFFEVDKEHKWLVPNMSSSAVVYPVGKRLFVQFFGLPRDVKVKDKRFVDYHYQNQTDPWYDDEQYRATKAGKPKSKAWMKKQAANYRERKKMWDRIFPGYEAPAQVGLSHEFICSADMLSIAEGIFKNVHGHTAFGDVEQKKVCTICNMAKRGITKDEPEEAKSDAAN